MTAPPSPIHSGGWSAVLLLVLVAVLSFPRVANAQYDDPELPWLKPVPHLMTDWQPAWNTLEERGLIVLADSTNFYFGNTAGGATRDFDFGGHGDYLLLVDGERRWGWEGFSAKLRAEHRYGETIEGDVGAFFSPTILANLPVADSEQLYLTNVLFTQMVSDDFAVFAGKMDTLDGDKNAFAHGRGKTQFSNIAFVFNPIVAMTVPYSTLGAGFVVLRDEEAVGGFSVLNANDTTSTSGFEQLFNDGALLSAYVRLPTRFLDLPGHHLLGGTWNSRTYISLSDAYVDYPNVSLPPTRGSWSLFWNFDQYLFDHDEHTGRGWGIFGRAGIADFNTNPLAGFLSFGIGGTSPVDSRDADTFGVGWYYAASSSAIAPIVEPLVGPVGNGQGVECYYNYELTPAVRLTPDVQVIIPALEALDPALVAGLRAQMIF